MVSLKNATYYDPKHSNLLNTLMFGHEYTVMSVLMLKCVSLNFDFTLMLLANCSGYLIFKVNYITSLESYVIFCGPLSQIK